MRISDNHKRIIRNSGTLIFLTQFAALNILLSVYIMKSKKVGVDYERKEKSFVCGQHRKEHFVTKPCRIKKSAYPAGQIYGLC